MSKFPAALFAEPDPDPDTLANLGPLRALAGVWEGKKGTDVKPTEVAPRVFAVLCAAEQGTVSTRTVTSPKGEQITFELNGSKIYPG